jgi:hypothetical protein
MHSVFSSNCPEQISLGASLIDIRAASFMPRQVGRDGHSLCATIPNILNYVACGRVTTRVLRQNCD